MHPIPYNNLPEQSSVQHSERSLVCAQYRTTHGRNVDVIIVPFEEQGRLQKCNKNIKEI